MTTEELDTKLHGDYTVGWICALSKEQTAATAMLDKRHGDLPRPPHDSNTYTLGSIAKHNVVIACLPEGRYGTNAAANVVSLLAGTFPSVRTCLMVGIGGGIPSNKVRLGDVVVGRPGDQFPGVLQLAMGRAKQGGEFERTGALDNPPKALLTALTKLKTDHELNGSKIPMYLDELKERYPIAAKKYLRSNSHVDICFMASYDHVTSIRPDRNAKGEDHDHGEEEDEEEDEVDEEKDGCQFCDKTKVVKRKPREMRVHYGLIASGNQVIKDAKTRDKLNKDLGSNVLCVEMEAAGIVNNLPCLVIRGICDYSDSHKNKVWQEHAAAVAAAYAKELLFIVQPIEVQGDRLIKDALSEVQETLNEIALGQKQRVLNKKQQAIYEWLSPLSPSARHVENQKKRVEGTGTWLLEDPNFLDWSLKKCRVLCCYGDPGAGKTIISSLMVDHLKEQRSPMSRIGLAYMYCDYRDHIEQTAENILGTLLTQLLEILPGIPEAVLNLYEQRSRSLSSEEAVGLLWVICAEFSKIDICIDALDELDTRNLRSLLKCLHEGPYSIQIFLTGRPHVQETVREYFEEERSITIEAHASDIRRFIEHEIGGSDDIEPKAMDKKLRTNIFHKIVDSAKGIFLLPTLQVRAVLQATTLRDREEALEEMPSNLGEAFAGTMTRIQQQPVALSERAQKIIAWIHLAERPIFVNELLCALAIKVDDTYFDRRGIPIRETLLNCCHGLAVADQETSTVRLVHYSLQEHLLQQDKMFELNKAQWHSRIACTCLTFLTFPPLTTREEPDRPEHNHIDITLLHYAATGWGHHLRRSEKLRDAAFELGKKYLDNNRSSRPNLHNLYKVMYLFDHDRVKDRPVLPAHIAAFLGLEEIMLHLISKKLNLSQEDVLGRTPLSWAALKGHEAVLKVLIDGNAEVDSVDVHGRTPLFIAAGNGHEVIVEMLIEKSAAVDLVDKYDRTPLSEAATNGHEAVVKILINRGVAVNSVDIDGWTPLSLAAANGHEVIVELLIDKGASMDSMDNDGKTPLSWAAFGGHEAVVEILINRGATVNSADNDGRTPLSLAAENEYKAIVEMLRSVTSPSSN